MLEILHAGDTVKHADEIKFKFISIHPVTDQTIMIIHIYTSVAFLTL